MERNLRGRYVDFQPAIDYVMQGEHIKAKHDIEKCLTGVTRTITPSALAILRYIEENNNVPESEELLRIIKEKEDTDAKRKLDVANMKAKYAKTHTAKAQETLKPHCPTCGSTDITKLGVASRAVSGAIFGALSVEGRAQFRCKHCGYQW